MLHPDARALLDLIAERNLPAMHTLTPVEARAFYRDRRGFTQPPAPEVGALLDTRCEGPHGAIPLRIYRPVGAPAASSSTLLPVLVYYHGGGWTIGDLDTHDVLCRQLCNGAGAVVVAVDYRMDPSTASPPPSTTAWRRAWVATRGQALGIDPAAAIGGDSAGGASPRSWRSWRAMPATWRSRTSYSSTRRPTCGAAILRTRATAAATS
jgi:acetyl esterase